MRILKIGIFGISLLLTACTIPQSQPVFEMNQTLAKASTNLSIVECSLGITMIDSNGNSYQDTSGICMNEMNSRLSGGTLTQAEFEIDKSRAQNEIAQYQQQQAISAANEREESKEAADRQNAIEVRNAICQNRMGGCY